MRPAPQDAQTTSAPAPNGRSGIFYGWWVLAASAVLGFAAFGVVIPGYLAFSVPVRTELGLSSGQSAFIVGAAWGIGDIISLAAGWLADRYGARRLVLAGGLLCGIGFAGLAFADSFWAIVLSYTVAASVGRGLGIFPTLMTVANQWFEDRKALALAIVNTAVTAGAAAILPALSYASGEIGWRTVALIAGGIVFALTLPAAAIIRSRPEDMGLEPYGSGRPERQASRGAGGRTRATGTARREYSVGQALGTLSFCALALGAILRTVPSDVLVINQIPILIWKGVAETRTSTYLSITYFATIPARFGMGLAATWVSPRLMLSLAMATVTLCTVATLGGARRCSRMVPDHLVGHRPGSEFAGMDHGGRVLWEAQLRDAGGINDGVLRNKRVDCAGVGGRCLRPDGQFCGGADGGGNTAGRFGGLVRAGTETGWGCSRGCGLARR